MPIAGRYHDAYPLRRFIRRDMVFELTAQAWLIAALAVLLTGISKSGFGSALGGVAVPILSLFLPPAEAAAVMLPILCVMDGFGVRAYWRKWAGDELRVLIPGAVLGIVVGTLVFGLLSVAVLKGLIGSIAVLFSLDRLLGLRARLRWNQAPGRVAGTLWAALSGLTSTLAHAGGPPVLVYLLGRKLDKERFIATTVVFFTAVNAAKVLPYLALGPVLPAGVGHGWLPGDPRAGGCLARSADAKDRTRTTVLLCGQSDAGLLRAQAAMGRCQHVVLAGIELI
jgi:uncharacterized membrane protein YfcA